MKNWKKAVFWALVPVWGTGLLIAIITDTITNLVLDGILILQDWADTEVI